MAVTTTELGRAKIAWPNAGGFPAVDLQTAIHGAIEKISDSKGMHYAEVTVTASGGTVDIVHNHNALLSNLTVLLSDSTGLFREDQLDFYPITQVDANTIRITNNTGSTKDFIVHILPYNLQRYFGIQSNNITTNDASSTLLGYLDCIGGSGQFVDVKVIAHDTVANHTNVYEYLVMIESGTPPNIGSYSVIRQTESEEAAGWGVAFNLNGATPTQLEVLVTGAAATQVEWYLRVDYFRR